MTMSSSTINLKVPVMTKQDLQTDDYIIVSQTLVQAEMPKEFGGKLFVLMQHMVLMLTSSN